MKLFFVSLLASVVSAFSINEAFCGKNVYHYNSLAGYGAIASNAKDRHNDTLGGFGSIAIDKNTWRQLRNGTYTGTLWAIPGRGWNTQGTLNYQPRIHSFTILFTPNTTAGISSPSPPNLVMIYKDTVLLTDNKGYPLTSLDPTGSKLIEHVGDLPQATYTGDGYGGGGPGGTRYSINPAGLALGRGGRFWISDEYGPYLYCFDATGKLLFFIPPPQAFIPRRNGSINFSSDDPPVYNTSQAVYPVKPDLGRANNQGFGGLTISPDGKTLTVALRSALTQDGGRDEAIGIYARMLTYNIYNANRPRHIHEYVIPLPTYIDNKGKIQVATQSEIHAITSKDYFILARDSGKGFGKGQNSTTSVYRHIDLMTFHQVDSTKGHFFSKVQSIHGKPEDKPRGSIIRGGTLKKKVRPLHYCSWLDMNVNSELGKFGLHNGGDEDSGLLNEKWESIAVVPVDASSPYKAARVKDWKNKHRHDAAWHTLHKSRKADKRPQTKEVFIFSFSDNDFVTQDGSLDFGKYKYKDPSGYNISTQALVFQATIRLHGAKRIVTP